MATIRAYITAKLARYNIEIQADELDGEIVTQGLTPTSEFTAGAATPAKRVLLSVIPGLLLQPDITEGGYSMKFDREGVRAFYGLLCAELGEENKLDRQPVVRDRSNAW